MCDYFNAKYDYTNIERPVWIEDCNSISNKEEPTEHHIGSRVYECDAYVSKDMKDGLYVAYGDGCCDWSSVSIITQEDSLKYSIGLREACKLLGVKVILDTEEFDIGFKEHYIIDENGEVLEEEYEELYDSYDEFYNCEDYEEFINEE